MTRLRNRLIPAVAALALVATLPGCAPRATGSTVSSRTLGSAAYVSYGTIVGSRPVQVAGGGGGIGTAAGAVAGGLAGSFIGGDVRSNLLAGLGGALIGGLAGTAVEGGMTQGNAIEFIVREDNGGDIAVVQTNEEALQAGDRVVITRGDRVRLSRAAGGAPAAVPYGAPPQGYPPQGNAPQGYAPQGYAPQGYAPQGYAPQGYAPQGYAPPQGYDAAPAGYRGNPK